MSERILIEYDAVRNAREGCGWIPMLWINGKRTGSTYYEQGVDRETAVDVAEVKAHEESTRYVGDWELTIRQRNKS